MPTYQRFEDLPAWQSAARLYDGVDALFARRSVRLSPVLRDRLEGAALAVSGAIAAGFERGSVRELAGFLPLALDSAAEVRSLLILAGRNPALARFRFELSDLKLLAESCVRQIRAWAALLPEPEPAPDPGGRQLRRGAPARQRLGL